MSLSPSAGELRGNISSTHHNIIFSSPSNAKISALVRQILDILTTIISYAWSYVSSLSVDTNHLDSIEKHMQQLENSTGSEGLIGIKNIQKKRKLNNNAVLAYLNALKMKKEAEGKKIQIVSNFITDIGNSKLPSKEAGAEAILIPVVLKGTFGDHIIAIACYEETNAAEEKQSTVAVYDPKGVVVSEHGERLVLNQDKLNLPQVLQLVLTEYGNAATVLWENQYKQQQDSHSCGIHTSMFLRDIASGYSPEGILEIEASCDGASVSKNDLRREMISDIVKYVLPTTIKNFNTGPEYNSQGGDDF